MQFGRQGRPAYRATREYSALLLARTGVADYSIAALGSLATGKAMIPTRIFAAAAAVLALSACAPSPNMQLLTRAQYDCRAGDRTACQQIPYMLEQVRIEHAEQEARRQAALLAISAAGYNYSANVARMQASQPRITFCHTNYLPGSASTMCY